MTPSPAPAASGLDRIDTRRRHRDAPPARARNQPRSAAPVDSLGRRQRRPAAAAPGQGTARRSRRQPAGATSGDLLAAVNGRWAEIVAWIGRNPANKPLVANCRPVEVRDGIVILGFPENQPFLREKAEQRRKELEDGLAHVLGHPVGVRCVVANVELAETSDREDLDLVAQARKVFGGDLADVTDVG